MTDDPSTTDLVPVAGDVSLRIIRAGDGGAELPFLLVHGLSSNAHLWDDVAADLAARGHASVAVDQRGHGRSSKPTTGYDFPTLVADLAIVLETCFDRPAIVAGQSWGGNVVVELAAHRPDLVAGVVCVDGGFIRLRNTFGEWSTAEERLRPPPLAGMQLADLEARMGGSLAGFPATGVAAQLANFDHLPDGTVRPWLTLDNHMRILRKLWEHDPLDVARSVASPVLVIAVGDGRGDKGTSVAEFVAAAPSASSHWIDAHHDVHAQHPHVVAELMASFAASVPHHG